MGHSAWITGLREQYAALGSLGPVPSGFGGLGEPQLHEHLDERFNEALDFVNEPVYRSASAHLSWQPANDELNFDSDEPVYRSLGGLVGLQLTTSMWMWRPRRARTRLGCRACPHSCSGRAPSAISDRPRRVRAKSYPPPPFVPVRSASGEISECTTHCVLCGLVHQK